MALQTLYVNFVRSLIQTMVAVLDKGHHAMTVVAC
ncbi:hypothetical protein MPB2EB_0601 [Mycoavidus sp. B2-EB]|nr:hypothetical protein MPB2EB_0601 [Mycoavidus sp. B2-EB]